MAAPRERLRDLPEMLELGILVGRVRRRIRARVQQELELRGRSIPTWTALRHLASAGPSTQREIAEATAQHPAQVSRQLAELEGQGLLRRWPDRADRRCRRVGITARGRRALGLANPVVSAGVSEALATLDEGELHALRALLRKALGLGA